MNADLHKKIDLDEEPYRLFTDFTRYPALDSMFSIYMLALGDYLEVDNYASVPQGFDRQFTWVIFILGSAVISVVLMNMLVGILAIPFAEIESNREKYMNKFKVEMIIDF